MTMAKIKKNKRKSVKKRVVPGNDPLVEIVETPASPKRTLRLSEAMNCAGGYTQRYKFQIAQSIYSQLMTQQPGRWEPAVALLNSLISVGHGNAAQVQAYRILAVLKHSARAVAEVAAYYNFIGKKTEAIDILQEGLEQCDPSEKFLLYRVLGIVEEAMGNREAALEQYRISLEHNATNILTLYNTVKLDSRQSRDELLEKLLQIEKSGDYEQTEVPHLQFAIAYLYEGVDDDKYFHHLTKANNAVAQNPAGFFNRIQGHLQGLSKFLTREKVATFPQAKDSPRRPPIFIIAPPRSGTTLLEQILGSHADTVAVGESGAFNAAINRVVQELGDDSLYWNWDSKAQRSAQSKFDTYFHASERVAAPEDKVVIDKSIENFQLVGLIVLTWPNAKIIDLRRHPLDTILSCYHQYFASGFDRFFNLESLAWYYTLERRYMDFWQQLFPDNFITIEYENLVADQENQTRQLLEFCELPWDDACLNFHENVGSVHTVSNFQVRQPMYKKSVDKWKRFSSQLMPAIEIIERELSYKLR